jgi:hypothetical protein
MDHKTIEKYKTTTCKDLYSKWGMDARNAWKRESVRAAFSDVYQFIHTKVIDDSSLSIDLDMELMEILERHRKDGGIAKFQAIFVALLLESMLAKDGDLYAKKRVLLPTHGYKCNLLSFLLAQLLGQQTIGPLLDLYRSPSVRNDVLSFFDLS